MLLWNIQCSILISKMFSVSLFHVMNFWYCALYYLFDAVIYFDFVLCEKNVLVILLLFCLFFAFLYLHQILNGAGIENVIPRTSS